MKQIARATLVILLIPSPNSYAQADFAPLRDGLQTTLDSIVTTDGLPGATLAVALQDGRLISLAAGFADMEANLAMPVGGMMLGGSTGKTFVSAVALQLMSEGKLRLDATVASYFPKETDAWFYRLPNATDLTVRSLMNHTSGLPDYVMLERFLAAMKANLKRSWKPQELLAFINDMSPTHSVGKGWGYSDTDYILLGLVIERVASDSFYNQAKVRLIDPYQLRHTVPATQPLLPGLVQGYIGTANWFGLPPKTIENGSYAMNPQFEWCGGGFVTNVDDLASWMARLHTGEVLEEAAYAQLIDAVDVSTGQPASAGYGLGTVVWATESGRFFGHPGVSAGYATHTEFSERHRFAIAFQTNTDARADFTGQRNHGHVQQLAARVIAFLAAGDQSL